MNRWVALAAVGLMLVVPVASGAEWLRSGYDPGRTGAIPFEGPATNDTVFQVLLPGVPTDELVVVDGQVYVFTIEAPSSWGGETEGLDERALWRVDLATAEVERLLDLSTSQGVVKVTPSLALVQQDDDLVAIELSTGEERWRTRVMETVPGNEATAVQNPPIGYSSALILSDNLYVSFDIGTDDGVAALDLATGEPVWDQPWLRRASVEDQRMDPTDPDTLGRPSVGPERFAGISGLAADQERVYVSLYLDVGFTSATNENRQQLELWALDAPSGEDLWDRNSTEAMFQAYSTSGMPTVTPLRVLMRMDAFQAFNPATGDGLWTSEAGRADQRSLLGAFSMGARGDLIIGTTEQTVARLHPDTGNLVWQQTDTTQTKTHGTGEAVVIDERAAYVPTSHQEIEFIGTGVDKRNLETGELIWSWKQIPAAGRPSFGSNTVPSTPAFAPGALVVGAKDGTVHVVGETEASLGQPKVEIPTSYPGVGENVSLGVADGDPGAFGKATRYRVFWGDGNVSAWQESPTFTHAYDEPGNITARVQAANQANQTSSTFVTMNVGQEAPAEPNMIETAFARENQDMTFGILGILVAVTGGAIGVGRRYRKRSRLEQELEALETGYEETKDRPGQCEAFLETRKGRARSLVLDGDLTEEQGSMIEARADELRRELRTHALSDEFGFLPYSLVTKAREMLEDGRVTSLEAEAFLAALQEVEDLTDDQRTRVRERITSWFARDTGGGASP